MKKFNKILVVDDNDLMRDAAKFIIREVIITDKIVEATNGKEALDLLTKESAEGKPAPELIVLDMQMPIMDGLEFLDELPKIDSLGHLLERVVVLTASTNLHYEKAVKAKGIKWYFHKPISLEILETVLSSVA
jgi:CheY-like chemotaxis protein